MQQSITAILVAAAASGAYAQTFSTCNPLLKSGCPSDPALGKAVEYDFTKGAPQDFTVSDGAAPTFDSEGAKFTIAKSGQAPTLSSKWYMMFGHYDIVLQTSKGVGTVSSLVLQSDDLDEIDWEWLGADPANVQTNYYGKGNTEVYDRGQTIPQAGNQDGFHTYSLDWTADAITWSVDGKQIRKLTPATADKNQYPQSPMQLKIGTWAGGDPAEPKGTIEWAGGEINYANGPYIMTVKSVKAVDYSTGKSYSYGDQSGSWQSMKSDGGKISSSGNSNAQAVQAPVSGTAVSQATGGANLNVPVPSGSAPPTVATAAASGAAQSAPGTVTAPFAAGNTTIASGTGAVSASTTLATAKGGSTTKAAPSGPSASVAVGNAAGHLTASAGTGLIAVLAAALFL